MKKEGGGGLMILRFGTTGASWHLHVSVSHLSPPEKARLDPYRDDSLPMPRNKKRWTSASPLVPSKMEEEKGQMQPGHISGLH